MSSHAPAAGEIEKLRHRVVELERQSDALRRSVENFFFSSEEFPSLICAVAPDLNFVLWNRECERVTGYAASEVVGRSDAWRTLFPNTNYLHEILRDWSERGEHFRNWELLVRCKDGSERTISWSCVPHESLLPGWLAGAVGVDITERKLAEGSLRRANERYGLATAASRIDVWEIDISTRLVRGERMILEWLGIDRESAPFQFDDWKKFHHPDDWDRVSSHFEGMFSGQLDGIDEDVRLRMRDGRHLWFHCNAKVVRDSNHRPIRIIGTVFDIDRNKRAEEALRESERRYRLLADNSADVIVQMDSHGWVQYVSPSVQTLLGYEPDELIGRMDDDFVHPEDLPVLRAERWAAPCSSVSLSFRVRHKSGRYVWVESSIRYVYADSGVEPIGSISTFRDITERKCLETQLANRQRMELSGQIAGKIGHAFNNLLGVITGYSDLMLTHELPPGVTRRALSQIQDAAQKSAELTERLLAFSRGNELELRHVELSDVLTETEPEIRRLLGEQVSLDCRTSRALGAVNVDPDQMRSLLLQLAANADNAMPDGGTLTLTVDDVVLDWSAIQRMGADGAPGHYACLTVTDTGLGMTPEVRERIFEPFYTTKTNGQGAGLGLAMANGVVKQSNGFIRVDSTPGLGTSIAIYLPIVDELASLESDNRCRSPANADSTSVLVVDDEDIVRNFAETALRMAGFTVVSSDGGQNALRCARRLKRPIELLITDVSLSHGGGQRVARDLRESYPDIKVLYMSGYSEEDPEIVAIAHEPNVSFLAKPFSAAILLQRVREICAVAEKEMG